MVTARVVVETVTDPELPALTLVVIAVSDFFVEYWWAIFGAVGGGVYAFFYFWKRSKPMYTWSRP